MKFRPICTSVSKLLSQVLRAVLLEMGVPKIGTAYAAPELDNLFKTYQNENMQYYMLEYVQKLFGGAGIAPLPAAHKFICELQKMYFLPEARGKRWGTEMINVCLQFAKSRQFKQSYIETMPNMKAAQKLYVSSGFEYIDKPMGNTGHHSCPIYLLKSL